MSKLLSSSDIEKATHCFRYNHVNELKIMYENNNLPREFITKNGCHFFQQACYYGYFRMCKWIHENFQLTKKEAIQNKNLAFRWASQQGHLRICEWLFVIFKLTIKEVGSKNMYSLRYAAKYDYFDVVKFLLNTAGLNRLTEETIKDLLCGIPEHKIKKVLESMEPFGLLVKPAL
jgi:hypothetical protein